MTSITQKFNHTYDPANRLTSVNGQAVQWDDNGNMLADGQAVYKYNAANKLVGVTKGTSSIVYAYSGLGDRLRQIADGVTTDYVLDINAGLTQVLQDNTNKYVYGNTRISQIVETQTGYFLPDALGSMRQMTDTSADLTLARAYDPYGNVVSTSSTGETVYGYTGEMQSGGLVHLRARDYASQLGRFTSLDTWEGNDEKSLSLNKWIFVEGNPINWTDHNGFCADYNGDGICENSDPYDIAELAQYGITLAGNWKQDSSLPNDIKSKEISNIHSEIETIATELGRHSKYHNKYEIFTLIYGRMIFDRQSNTDGLWHCQATGLGVTCYIGNQIKLVTSEKARVFAHELGHVFNNKIVSKLKSEYINLGISDKDAGKYAEKFSPYGDLSCSTIRDRDWNWVSGNRGTEGWVRGFDGYLSSVNPDVYHGKDWEPLDANEEWKKPPEEFADLFLNWAHKSFAKNPAGTARYDWMENNMDGWVRVAIQ